MIRRLLFAILLFCTGASRAQNLLGNPGFEDRNICNEYKAPCSAEAWFRIPLTSVTQTNGTAGYFLGNNYESVVMENYDRPGFARTFIYTKLLCSIEKGKEYKFSASVRTNNYSFHHLDLLLTSFEPFHFRGRINAAKNRITILPANETGKPTDGWKRVEIKFTATGDEQYLLLGNLSADVMRQRPRRGMMLYDLDNLSLTSVDTTVKACVERGINEQLLYAHNNRHTPRDFLDAPAPSPVQPPPPPIVVTETKKDTVVKPVTPNITPTGAPVNDTLVVPDVLFFFDKSELNPAFAHRLDTLVEKIRSRTFKRMEISGHTDNYGVDDYNIRLSQRRAETVKNYLLMKLNHPTYPISTKGYGESMPVSTNATSQGRQKNRRVEIVLVR